MCLCVCEFCWLRADNFIGLTECATKYEATQIVKFCTQTKITEIFANPSASEPIYFFINAHVCKYQRVIFHSFNICETEIVQSIRFQ